MFMKFFGSKDGGVQDATSSLEEATNNEDGPVKEDVKAKRDEDAMSIERASVSTPELIPDVYEHKPQEDHTQPADSSVVNNAALSQGRKRPNDADHDMMSATASEANLKQSRNKKPRSPTPSDEVELVQGDFNDRKLANLSQHQDASEIIDTSIDDEPAHPSSELVKDLETKAITTSQLIQEVKGIYAGLVMVERKCIEIVAQQAQNPTKLSKEQWQALIALHRTLLNEHHDFFSASHHPVTMGHELRELAARYAMPARMWRHGIHAFLELLRHRLPESLDYMLSFVYLAYSMMTLLMETVPDFLETWIECLGDLARYRMAIEETDLRDREIWSNTARTWYDAAADLSPNTGRIQHHLAVLARPNIVQQLYLYSKALIAAVPFKNARESILLLFNPLIDQINESTNRYQPAEFNFVCTAAILFKRRSVVEFQMFEKQFFDSFEGHLTRTGSRFKVSGPEYAGSLFSMFMDFGDEKNPFWNMLFDHQEEMKTEYCEKTGTEMKKLPKDFVVSQPSIIEPARANYWKAVSEASMARVPTPALAPEASFSDSQDISAYAGRMMYKAISEVASHIGNKNVVPFMHMVLAYLYALTYVPNASIYIEACIPWSKVADFLNTVGRSGISYDNVESPEFPKSFGGSKRQLPEDFVMRGLMAMTYYYKPGFFAKEELVDQDERLLEQPSHSSPRVERCLWAAIQLSETTDRWLSYDRTSKQFRATEFSQAFQVS